MEAVLQFDPANMSIWSHPIPIGGEEPDCLNDVVRTALAGRHSDAIKLVRATTDQPLRIRAANVLSAVWHEQRHFVDVLLTNFGQSVFRQYSSLIINIPNLVQSAKSQGRLAVPISIYDRPIRRRALGIPENAELRGIASNLRGRMRMLEDDTRRNPIPSGGEVSVGGWAQLEALGYFTQAVALQQEFDFETAKAVQRDMPDSARLRHQYQWAAFLGLDLNLDLAAQAPSRPVKGSEGEQVVQVIAPAIAALIYGTLMVRRWGQQQTVVEGGHTGSAIGRIDPLLEHFKSSASLREATSAREAWQAVDKACEVVFGRSATDELRIDLEHESRFLDRVVIERGPDAEITRFLICVHDERVRLANRFISEPEMVVDPTQYRGLLNEVFPIPIFVDLTGGQEPAPGWQSLWTDSGELGNLGRLSWSWASAPLEVVQQSERIHLARDPAAWTMVVRDLVPMTKVLIGGRGLRNAIGPEMHHGESSIEMFDIGLIFDPVSATPSIDVSPVEYWYFTRRPDAACDGCDLRIARGSGNFVSGDSLRHSTLLLDWLVKHWGDGEYGYLMARKDWSAWFLCNACFEEVVGLGLGKPEGSADPV